MGMGDLSCTFLTQVISANIKRGRGWLEIERLDLELPCAKTAED